MLIRPMQLLATLVLASSSIAAPNAADDYRELARRWDALAPGQVSLLDRMPSQFEPSPHTVSALRTIDGLSAIVVRAGRKEQCDFELDYSQGLELEIPHLPMMREVARALSTLARWHQQQGNGDKAFQFTDAVYGAGFHAGDDRLLISSLVGQSIFMIAEDMTTQLVESGAVTPESASRLLRRLKAADPTDPFRMVDAMEMEKQMMIRSVDQQVHGAESMRLYAEFMDQVVEVFTLEDEATAIDQIQKLEQQLLEGQYGDLAKLLAIAPQGAIKQKFAGQRTLAERIAMLEDIANGTVDPMEHANAAWWYLRAAKAMSQLTPPQRMMPDQWKPIHDDLLLATVIDRCEFPFAVWRESIDPSYPMPVVPPWSAGLRLCLDQLIETAAIRLSEGELDDAISLTTTALDIAADLASNITLVDSLTAQDATERIIRMLQPMLDAGTLSPEHRQQLLQSARAIPARDPFGYMQASDATRRILITRSESFLSPEVIRGFPNDPDGVLFATAWCEPVHQTDEPFGFIWPLETDWSVFERVLDRDIIAEARVRGAESMEAASVGVDVEIDPIERIATPSIEDRRRYGVETLRTWKRTLAK